VVEFLQIIEPLAHPERFGGRVEDAFDVIAPFLPGFGYSGHPPRPIGPCKKADVFNRLMTYSLGYSGYLDQRRRLGRGVFILAWLRPRAGVPGDLH